MKLIAELFIAIVFLQSFAYSQSEQLRLTPAEIAEVPSQNAGTGTSGVTGIQTRTLEGDASKPGSYTIELAIPAKTRIKAHTHVDDRVATVISGTWYIGYGDSFDEKKLKALAPGSFYTEPPGVEHFAMTADTPVVLRIEGFGPSDTVYVEGVPAAKTYTSEFADAGGVRLHYLKAGTGKKVILLFHGFGDDARMWTPLFAGLGKDYTLIAPDLPGIGQSGAIKTYDKKTAAIAIHQLIQKLGYRDIYVVGHDIGLMVAYAYAAQYPDEVKKLALLEAPIPGIGDVWPQIFTNAALWHFHFVDSPIALDLVRGRERVFLEHFWTSFGGDLSKFSEADKRMYAISYAQPGVMRNAFEYFRAFDKQDATDNREFAKTKLPMPLLVIDGDKSMNGVLAIQARLVSDHVTALMFHSGHWLMEEKPAETESALRDFFQAAP
ncbi:MAG: hypothetical protein DMF63_02685 [Acidobacteria bacterium]|nr:MAG: hypothetical protein DMF63_02685 [Acidobacteriota bacterium]